MELLIVFYPSIALGLSVLVLMDVKAVGLDHGNRMYDLGKKHGREEAALRVYKLSVEMHGDDGDDDA